MRAPALVPIRPCAQKLIVVTMILFLHQHPPPPPSASGRVGERGNNDHHNALQAPEEAPLGEKQELQLFLMADSISGLDQQYAIPVIVEEASDSDSDSDSSGGSSGSNNSGSSGSDDRE